MRTDKLISKGDLCRLYGLYSERTQRNYYDKLRKRVFTDKFLQEIGIGAEDYSRIRIFNAAQTTIILEKLKLDRRQLAE